MNIERYCLAHQSIWNEFVRTSRNGTFLIDRGYMDYHADRFNDHSLLIFNDSKLVAILPGHQHEINQYASHLGLSHGGIIIGNQLSTIEFLRVFDMVATYLQSSGFQTWLYKPVPAIYHSRPAEMDQYALFLADAKRYQVDLLSVVNPAQLQPFQERRERAIRKAHRAGVLVAESADWADYWRLLEESLANHHNTKPVHSLAEIYQLQAAFPNNIRLFVSTIEEALLGGVVIYESQFVAHTQYIAASEDGRQVGALDILFRYLLRERYIHKAWFDFGTSNDDGGHILNRGLIEQKEGFGGQPLAQERYSLELTDYEAGKLLKAFQ